MHLKGMYALHLQSTGKVEPPPSGTKVIEDINIYVVSLFFANLYYFFLRLNAILHNSRDPPIVYIFVVDELFLH
jgi:hypothetical protein